MERSVIMSQYHESLYQLTNNSNLDIGSIYFIVKNFYNDIANTYQQYLNKAIQEMEPKEITIVTNVDDLNDSYIETVVKEE